MIQTAVEFVALRTSTEMEKYLRAAHDSATNEVWLEVIEKYPEMRKWVAHNKTVPIHILSLLAHDPDDSVRHSVAMKNKLTPELFELLGEDGSESIRSAIACNKNTPLGILEKLAKDPVPGIAEHTSERIRMKKYRS